MGIRDRIAAAGAALLVLAGAAAPAAAEGALERVREAGYLRVGFPNQVPYAYATVEGTLTGADAEVAREVARRMEAGDMQGVLTEFAGLIPGLKAGRMDVALAMFVNPTRCREVLFSEPIYGIGQALVVAEGNPKGIAGYDDLVSRDDVSFGIMAGAVQGIYAEKLGIDPARVMAFPDGPAAVAAVGAGRVDAFGISSLSARRMVEAAGEGAGVELLVGFADPVIDGKPARGYGAFAFRKEDEDLRDAFDAALATLIGTPEHLAIIAEFGFGEENLPDTTTAALCAG